MNEAWGEGYFTDIAYTYGYYREVSPLFQRFCLLLRGQAAMVPDNGPDAWHCELGYGQGVSVNIHAAANPGRFMGTDFNPAHAAHANQLAQAAGSGALLYDDSFEQFLARRDLPQFDSISLHGVWSWVSLANRNIITQLARRHLKPGGVMYVSYNSMPGWSPANPLRHLFVTHDRYGTASGNAVERVESALEFSESLLAARPNYLQTAPHLVEHLKSIATQNRHYLAHEYFNQDWRCMYFTEVVDALTAAKLDFACTAVPQDAIDTINLSEPAQQFLDGLGHPVLREQVRDYFVNKQFRKDLFVRGRFALLPGQQREQMLDSRLVLTTAPDLVPMTIQGAQGEGRLQETHYRPFLDILAEQHHAPKTLRTIAARMPQTSWPILRQIVTVLTGMGAIAPCQSDEAQAQVRDRCRKLNSHLFDLARHRNDILTLASPVLGGGVAMGRFDQLFLHAREEGLSDPDQWAAATWTLLDEQDQRIMKDGKKLETPEENLAELQQQARDFNEVRLPICKSLGIAD
ncbi:MAG: class I SAM-dependent methyltransferase [Castellaniella sp.]